MGGSRLDGAACMFRSTVADSSFREGETHLAPPSPAFGHGEWRFAKLHTAVFGSLTDELSEEDDALRKRGRRQVKKEEFGFEIALGAMEFSPFINQIFRWEKKIERFKAAAASNFGSGWTWLAYKANRLDVANAINPLPTEEDKKLVIVKTPNAVNPLVWDYSPLLAIDTWEHAYYLDFENRRAEYINIFMGNSKHEARICNGSSSSKRTRRNIYRR
ncbi:unnamed protein product [Brassica rapa subsp. trilocularis]